MGKGKKVEINGDQLTDRLREAIDIINRYHTYSKEAEYEAFRRLIPQEPLSEREEQQGNEQAGADNTSVKNERHTELNYNRVFWVARYFWYRGIIKPMLRYHGPGLLSKHQRVGWEGIAESYRREHPDDQAKTKTLRYSYNQVAKDINPRQVFSLFHSIFLMRCSATLTRFFGDELTLDERKELDAYFDESTKEILEGWEGKQPLKGDELISFALEHWEEILQFRRTLLTSARQQQYDEWLQRRYNEENEPVSISPDVPLFPICSQPLPPAALPMHPKPLRIGAPPRPPSLDELQRCEEQWAAEKQLLEQYRDYIHTYHAIPTQPAIIRTPSLRCFQHKYQPLDILDDEPVSLFFFDCLPGQSAAMEPAWTDTTKPFTSLGV